MYSNCCFMRQQLSWQPSPIPFSHALGMGRLDIFLHDLFPPPATQPPAEKALHLLDLLYFVRLFTLLRLLTRQKSPVLLQAAQLKHIIRSANECSGTLAVRELRRYVYLRVVGIHVFAGATTHGIPRQPFTGDTKVALPNHWIINVYVSFVWLKPDEKQL